MFRIPPCFTVEATEVAVVEAWVAEAVAALALAAGWAAVVAVLPEAAVEADVDAGTVVGVLTAGGDPPHAASSPVDMTAVPVANAVY